MTKENFGKSEYQQSNTMMMGNFFQEKKKKRFKRKITMEHTDNSTIFTKSTNTVHIASGKQQNLNGSDKKNYQIAAILSSNAYTIQES